jgi:hypothetical protein
MTPWITKDGRHINVARRMGGRRGPYREAYVRPSGKSSLAGVRKVRDYPDGQYLVKYRLPDQQAFGDDVKSEAVEAVRKRYGPAWADAASVVLDRLIKSAAGGARWSTEGEVRVGLNGVRGKASAEFTVDPLAAAGLKLPDGAPAPKLYAKVSLRYDGNLKTGRLDVTKVRAECGLKADLPEGQAGVSISVVP